MAAIKGKYQRTREDVLRDARPMSQRLADTFRIPSTATMVFGIAATVIYIDPMIGMFADLIFLFALFYFIWLYFQKTILPFKLPKTAQEVDMHHLQPNGKFGKSDGILYIGNEYDTGDEIWFTNSDARTHILYLGTTGAGKTEGLKALATNALCWGSGFIYVDGKADTDLWSSLSSLCRRFGRDDDLLVMNYMTGNAGGIIASNTLNPFSTGSASYLTNMLVSLMPDAEGDNAMWKERAVALASAIMPCLVWKRENLNVPLNVSVIRKYLEFSEVIRLSRDEAVPEVLRIALFAYLNELPGYVEDAFDDEGHEKPMPPDAPMVDTSVPRQQHGYLSMQFTRSLQSLGDDYAYIFDTQAADVDMTDVVLQRRILVALIPALEKSSDETANLGKIIASTLKGMMGATLGSTVEGASETAIENKPTRSETPFMAIFDEVGYYAAQGMAVMAAQARSLGFCLVYAAQDLPAMEKRIKEEARSIAANCNIKIFGKLEDPTQTKEFFEKTVGQALVTEVGSFTRDAGSMSGSYNDTMQANVQARARADYDDLRGFKEGRAICAFGEQVAEVQIYYANPGFAKAMRVQRFLPIPPPNEDAIKSMRQVNVILKRLRNKKWDPEAVEPVTKTYDEVEAIAKGFKMGKERGEDSVVSATMAVSSLAEYRGIVTLDTIAAEKVEKEEEKKVEDNLATVTKGKSPISWTDIIGGEDDGKNEQELVGKKSEQLSDEAKQAELRRTPPPVVDPSQKEMLEVDTPPSSPPVKAPPVLEKESGAMSWMDIIGGEEETSEAKTEETEMTGVSPSETVNTGALLAKKTTDNVDEEEHKALTWSDVLADDSSPIEEETNHIKEIAEPIRVSSPKKVVDDEAFSWADIIGSSDEKEEDK